MDQSSFLNIILYILLFELIIYMISLNSRGKKILERIGLDASIFMILVRRKSALDILDRVRGSRKTDILMRIGVPIMFFLMILFYIAVYLIGVSYIASFLGSLLRPGGEVVGPPPIAPIIPGLTIGGVDLIYLLIALGLSIAFHELGHAIASKIYGVSLKSYGAGIFLIMPLAFVEVDENSMMRDRRIASRILSAGVLFNIILFAIAFASIMLITWISPFAGVIQGAVIAYVEPGSPAYNAGIQPGLLITYVNGSPVYSLDRFLPYRSVIASDRDIILNITGVYPNGSIFSTLVFKPSNLSRIGVVFDGVSIPLAGFFVGALIIPTENGYIRLWALESILRFMVWMSILNLSLAVINAAPLYITDGGKFLALYLSNKISNAVQLVTVAGFAAIFIVSLVFYLS
ncbi:MAG: site-2 protease family protein [Sulfolobales archaeon]